MSDENLFFIVLFCAFLIFVGFQWGKSEYQPTIIELQNLKTNYAKLNEKHNLLNQSYNQLNLSYVKLSEEYNLLKNKHESLVLELTSYFVEETIVDLLPLKKYRFIYDVAKITFCNKEPNIIFC